MEYVYRYDGTCYSAGIDEWGNPLPHKGRREIHCSTFHVDKTTPCGVWIMGKSKFINLKAHKRWACSTEREALESFILRKQSQIRILTANLEDAHTFLEQAKCLHRSSTSTPPTSSTHPLSSPSTVSSADIASSPPVK